MTTSILEKLATEVANDVQPPDEPQATDESPETPRGSFVAIITLIMGIVQGLLENCPAPASRKRLAFKRMTRGQEAAVWSEVYAQCNCAGVKSLAGPIFNSIKVKGSTLSDVDANALIKETSDSRNLLV